MSFARPSVEVTDAYVCTDATEEASAHQHSGAAAQTLQECEAGGQTHLAVAPSAALTLERIAPQSSAVLSGAGSPAASSAAPPLDGSTPVSSSEHTCLQLDVGGVVASSSTVGTAPQESVGVNSAPGSATGSAAWGRRSVPMESDGALQGMSAPTETASTYVTHTTADSTPLQHSNAALDSEGQPGGFALETPTFDFMRFLKEDTA
jgi:hypothetical protein